MDTQHPRAARNDALDPILTLMLDAAEDLNVLAATEWADRPMTEQQRVTGALLARAIYQFMHTWHDPKWACKP